MSDRCIWSNQRDPGVRRLDISGPWGSQEIAVCPEHEAEALRVIAESSRRWALFFYLLFALALCAMFLSVLRSALVFGVIISAFGLVLVALPFVTPQTILLLGLRNGRRLGRALGVAIVISGVLMAAGFIG